MFAHKTAYMLLDLSQRSQMHCVVNLCMQNLTGTVEASGQSCT